MTKRMLMVMTSHEIMGDTGKKTGMWLEEFAAPYYACLLYTSPSPRDQA